MSTWRKGIAVVACLLVVLIALPAAAKAPAGKTLGIKAAEFEARFNEAAARVGSKVSARDVEIKAAEAGDVLKVRFSLGVNIMGAVNQASELREVGLFFIGSEKADAARFISCAMTLVEMFTPGLSPDRRAVLLQETGFFDPNRQKGECVRGSVKYTHTKGGGYGVTFGVAGS